MPGLSSLLSSQLEASHHSPSSPPTLPLDPEPSDVDLRPRKTPPKPQTLDPCLFKKPPLPFLGAPSLPLPSAAASPSKTAPPARSIHLLLVFRRPPPPPRHLAASHWLRRHPAPPVANRARPRHLSRAPLRPGPQGPSEARPGPEPRRRAQCRSARPAPPVFRMGTASFVARLFPPFSVHPVARRSRCRRSTPVSSALLPCLPVALSFSFSTSLLSLPSPAEPSWTSPTSPDPASRAPPITSVTGSGTSVLGSAHPRRPAGSRRPSRRRHAEFAASRHCCPASVEQRSTHPVVRVDRSWAATSSSGLLAQGRARACQPCLPPTGPWPMGEVPAAPPLCWPS